MTQKDKIQNNHKYFSEKDIISFKQCKEGIEGIGDKLELTLDSLYATCKNHDFSIIIPKINYYTNETYQKIKVNNSALELIHFKEGAYIYNGSLDNYEIDDNFIYKLRKDDKVNSIFLLDNKRPVGDINSFLKHYSSSIFQDIEETKNSKNMGNTIHEFGYIIGSILTTEEDLKKELNKRRLQMQRVITNLDKYFEKSKGVPYMLSLYHNNEEGFFRIFPQLNKELKEMVVAEIYNQKSKNQNLEDRLCKTFPELVEKVGRMKVPDNRKGK